jgi:hypothetical protein
VPKKPDQPTEAEALKRISDIKKAKATLDKTNEITAMIVATDPEKFSGMLGQSIKPEHKQELMNAWDKEIEYLQQFTSAGKTTKTFTFTESGELVE